MSAADSIVKVGTGTKNMAVGVAIIAATAALGYVGFKAYRGAQAVSKAAGEAVDAVGAAVNPTADTNLAYRSVNAWGSTITGDNNFSLGSWLYDITH